MKPRKAAIRVVKDQFGHDCFRVLLYGDHTGAQFPHFHYDQSSSPDTVQVEGRMLSDNGAFGVTVYVHKRPGEILPGDEQHVDFRNVIVLDRVAEGVWAGVTSDDYRHQMVSGEYYEASILVVTEFDQELIPVDGFLAIEPFVVEVRDHHQHVQLDVVDLAAEGTVKVSAALFAKAGAFPFGEMSCDDPVPPAICNGVIPVVSEGMLSVLRVSDVHLLSSGVVDCVPYVVNQLPMTSVGLPYLLTAEVPRGLLVSGEAYVFGVRLKGDGIAAESAKIVAFY